MEERKGLLGRVMEKCAVTARLHQNYLRREMGKTGISKSQRQLLLYIEKNPGATQRDCSQAKCFYSVSGGSRKKAGKRGIPDKGY